MSDDLDAVIREMWPGLEPGTKYVVHSEHGEVLYSAAWLDDRRLQTVPDKEQSMEEETQTERPQHFAAIRPALDAYIEAAAEMPMPQMQLSDALATFAETVGDAGRINADVHGLPIQFFARDDVEDVNTLVSQGRVLITGQLVIGGHRFLCFSEGFPMGAE